MIPSFVQIGDCKINPDHVVMIEFTIDLDLKIHLDTMAEPRAAGNFMPTSDKPLVLLLRKGTPAHADAVAYFEMTNILAALEHTAKQTPPKKEKGKR